MTEEYDYEGSAISYDNDYSNAPINNNNNINNTIDNNNTNNTTADYHQNNSATATHNITATSNVTASPATQPDHQPPAPGYKIFIGQLPSDWVEINLRQVFSIFGNITNTFVMRDKQTGNSKGCGFVTFTNEQSALDAIEQMHEKYIPPGGHRTLIVRMAAINKAAAQAEKATQNAGAGEEPDWKLYIAHLDKSTTEDEVKQIFGQFGVVQELFLMFDKVTGEKKGNGFIKMANKAQALAAIAGLHEKYVDKSQQQPIQVRFAHSREDRAKFQHKAATPFNDSIVAATAAAAQAAAIQQAQAAAAMQMQAAMFNPAAAMQMQQMAAMQGNPAAAMQQMMQAYQQQALQAAQYAQFAAVNPMASFAPPSLSTGNMNSNNSTSASGSTIFVYGIPETYEDNDLYNLFSGFGTITSAKVQKHPTGASKCFGFVGFTDAGTAQQAIARMDGFQLGPKRLNVKMKTSKGPVGGNTTNVHGSRPY
jgi:CUG-BP- and ETR3-like factor